MTFYVFGDEERFLLDRIKELNRNFDKETRIKFLKSEVRKREQLLRKKWRNHKHKRRKKKGLHKEQINNNKMPLEDIEEGTDLSENEENLEDTCQTKPFLYYLSEYMDNDTSGCETSENEGLSDNNDGFDNETRDEPTELSKDNSERESEAEEDNKETDNRRNTVVGGLLTKMHGVLSGFSRRKTYKSAAHRRRPQTIYYWDSVSPAKEKPVIDYGTRKSRRKESKSGLTIKNDRQALKVLGLLENSEKNKEIRVVNVHNFSENEIMTAFQKKCTQIGLKDVEGLQEVHEAYQILLKIILASKDRFKKKSQATVQIIRLSKMMTPAKPEKKKTTKSKKHNRRKSLIIVEDFDTKEIKDIVPCDNKLKIE